MTMVSLAATEIDRLLERHPKGYDLTLERVRRLLAALGDPQNRIPAPIHVAGTNGKGSVTAFCRAILEAERRAVHVHTSPHLVSWHERYRLGRSDGPGRLVEDALLARTVARAAQANGDAPITVFEILTAVTFLLFSEHPADASLIEVGLGGRFDATNVIPAPAVTAITSIALDHQSYLGDRVELIAMEKAGIIKPGVPVVIGQQSEDVALDVLLDAAERAGAPALVYGQDFLGFEEQGRFVYQDEDGLLDLPLPRLPGRHQLGNAACAIATLRHGGFAPSERSIEAGMTGVEWPGRLQKIGSGPLLDLLPEGSEVWLDGGHNPGAGIVIAEALANLEERVPRPLFMVTGMLNTKDPAGFFGAFESLAQRVLTVPLQNSDAGVDPEMLAASACEAGLPASASPSVEAALKRISQEARGPVAPRVLLCGSLYLVGEILAASNLAPR